MIVYLTILPGKQQQTPFFLVLIFKLETHDKPVGSSQPSSKDLEKKE